MFKKFIEDFVGGKPIQKVLLQQKHIGSKIALPLLMHCQISPNLSPSFHELGLNFHKTFNWPTNPDVEAYFVKSSLQKIWPGTDEKIETRCNNT